jgi:hypothetical protein
MSSRITRASSRHSTSESYVWININRRRIARSESGIVCSRNNNKKKNENTRKLKLRQGLVVTLAILHNNNNNNNSTNLQCRVTKTAKDKAKEGKRCLSDIRFLLSFNHILGKTNKQTNKNQSQFCKRLGEIQTASFDNSIFFLKKYIR